MARLTINKQGFYPIVKPIDEDVSVSRLSNKSFYINMPDNCSVTIYVNDTEIQTTAENEIDLSDLPVEMLINARLSLHIFKTVLGYTVGPIIKELMLELVVCDENDDLLLYCSDTLLCS